jgi:hypothetical protein
MRMRPFIGTLIGTAIGLLATIAWMVTFEPHGGPEGSHYLFPGSAILLERMFPSRSIPVPLWYGGAFLNWVIPGVVVDLLRRVYGESHIMKTRPDYAPACSITVTHGVCWLSSIRHLEGRPEELGTRFRREAVTRGESDSVFLSRQAFEIWRGDSSDHRYQNFRLFVDRDTGVMFISDYSV